MAAQKVRYPGPGCVVEFMQGNSPTLAVVLEEHNGRLRLYAKGRKEVNLQAARLLPWAGPVLHSKPSRQEMDEEMERRALRREELAEEVDPSALWELAQGEWERAPIDLLAGLLWQEPGVDHEAGLARALLQDKSRFRFSPPDFEIFPREIMEKRLAEAEAAPRRDAAISAGAAFFRLLWDVHNHKRLAPKPEEEPEADLKQLLQDILSEQIADPDAPSQGLWKPLIKGLPEHPYMAVLLAEAWNLVPEHYNFHLDRAGFRRGEAWVDEFAETGAVFRQQTSEACSAANVVEEPGFISIDPATTLDRDDAVFAERLPDGGFEVRVALACPAGQWPFGTPLDKAVLRRASSLYLPEGHEHMLPGGIGRRLFSLDEGNVRLGLMPVIRFTAQGHASSVDVRLGCLRVSANLSLQEAEGLLIHVQETGQGANPPQTDVQPEALPANQETALPEHVRAEKTRSRHFPFTDKVRPYAEQARNFLALTRLLQAGRIANGAVITERPDPEIRLYKEKGLIQVDILNEPEPYLAHLVVGELMIAANACLTRWAVERDIPLFFRTQDVALPKEFAGIWDTPQDIARIVRSLPPSSLEVQPRRHAGLGLNAYATFSSPIRRYIDLINQGQIVSFLQTGAPRFSPRETAALLPLISARSDAVARIQRFRPRYWKLLFFRRQGDKQWWDAVVTEENERFVTVSLPWAQLIIRTKRRTFDEKVFPGQPVQVRIGKVNPLLNEISVVEAREA